MKITLFALFIALLMVGCGESSTPSDPDDSPKAIDLDDPETLDKILAEAIDRNKLKMRRKKGEELAYAPNELTPYTGWIKSMYDNGQTEGLMQFKDGKPNGLSTLWYENGQKEVESNVKDGKPDGFSTLWYKNGQKQSEGNQKNGKPDGLQTFWYENGQIQKESRWAEDKLMSAEAWKSNGEKCPDTNVKNGNGFMVWDNEDGRQIRLTFKDGKRVED